MIRKSDYLVLLKEDHDELLHQSDIQHPENLSVQHTANICVEVVPISDISYCYKSEKDLFEGATACRRGSIPRRIPYSNTSPRMGQETPYSSMPNVKDEAFSHNPTGSCVVFEGFESNNDTDDLHFSCINESRSNPSQSRDMSNTISFLPLSINKCVNGADVLPCIRCQVGCLFQGEMVYFSVNGQNESQNRSLIDRKPEENITLDGNGHCEESTIQTSTQSLAEVAPKYLELHSLPFCVSIIAIIIFPRYIIILREPLATEIDIYNRISVWKATQKNTVTNTDYVEQPSYQNETSSLIKLWICYQFVMASSYLSFQPPPYFSKSESPFRATQRIEVNGETNWIKVMSCFSTSLNQSECEKNLLPTKTLPFSAIPPSKWSLPSWIEQKTTKEATQLMMSAWCSGLISNYDYLMYLNFLAGRRVGDPERHPLMPWVCDFMGSSPSVNRDLSLSKFRIAKVCILFCSFNMVERDGALVYPCL